MNDRKITNARFFQVNQLPQNDSHLTAKLYVDRAISYSINESSLLKLVSNEKSKLDEQDSITLYSNQLTPRTRIEVPTKSYVDRLPEINRNRRDLSSVFNDQDIEFDNNTLTNLDSVAISVGNDTCNLTKNDKLQSIDTTIINYPNSGGYLLQQWNIKCNDKNNNGKIRKFVRSTKTNSPSSNSGAGSLPPKGNAFMYI